MVKGDELNISMHVHFNSWSDYAESLKLITFVVVLFQVIENWKSALSEKVICYLGL